MKQGFKLGAIFAAISGLFATKEIRRALPEMPMVHDDFSHARNRRQLHSRAFIRKYRRLRNIKNEMAFQSRKRSRTLAGHSFCGER